MDPVTVRLVKVARSEDGAGVLQAPGQDHGALQAQVHVLGEGAAVPHVDEEESRGGFQEPEPPG